MTTDGKQLIAAIMEGGGNGYDIVDLLYKHNIKTYLLTPKKLRDGKYPSTELLLCPSTDKADDLVSFINTKIATGENVVLVPSSSEFALFLARHREKLDKRFLFCLPDASLLDDLDNKMLFFNLCQKHGISCPKTFIVRNIKEFEESLEDIKYPVIVKPFRSRQWQESIGYKVVIAQTEDALRNIISKTLSSGCEVIIQDMIPGGAETDLIVGGFYDENSEPVKLYVGQKLLQHPLDIGIGCYVGLTWKQEAVDLVNNFAKKTGYRGLVDVDLKYDTRDNTYKIIEVNPRNGLSHKISSDGQWDLLSFYVNWISGNKDIAKDFKSHEDGRKWIYPHEHLCSRIEEKGIFKGIARWFKDMRSTRLRCAWDMKDYFRCYRYLRVVIGHTRHLNLRQIIFGRKIRTQ